MIKQLIVFYALISTGVCEIYTLGGFGLMSSISDVRASCERMELIEDMGFSRHYQVFNNNPYEWKLIFHRNSEGKFYLSQILMIIENTSYANYNGVSVEYSKLQGRYPDIINTPDVLPLYSSYWNTEYTHFGVTYNPELGRLIIVLRANL